MVIICRYGEIFLKGLNRPQFERALVKQISSALRGVPHTIKNMRNRILVDAGDIRPLQRVFGISSLSPALAVPIEIKAITTAALALLKEKRFASFRVATQRITKTGSYSSAELNSLVGDAIRKAANAAVNLGNPDITIGIEILHDAAYVFIERILGPGGLPVGVSGTVTVWMDDPYAELAALLMCKRGCVVRGAGTNRPQLHVLQHYIRDFEFVSAPMELISPIVRGTLTPQDALSERLLSTSAIPHSIAKCFNTPAFYPLIGMTAQDADARLSYYAHLY